MDNGGGKNTDIYFDRTFRSVHADPSTAVTHHGAAAGYWTLDWLTHPLKQIDGASGDANLVSVPVNNALCLDQFAEKCLVSPTYSSTAGPTVDPKCVSADAEFSCAKTVTQSRYGPGVANRACSRRDNSYERTACQMQRSADMSLVVNDDKAFSVSSGHSTMVLLFYVSTIMFTINLFTFWNTKYWRENALVGKWNTCEALQYNKKLWAVVMVVVVLIHRMIYHAQRKPLDVQSAIPNGSFFYGFISLFATAWLAACEDCGDVSATDKANENGKEEEMQATLGYQPPDSAAGPPGTLPPVVPGAAPMTLNISSFQSNKMKLNAFLQPGKDGNYPLVLHTDLTTNRSIGEDDYKVRPATSVWALTQLWVLPLLVLSVFILRSNYQMDIDVTVVFVGTFVIGLIELFTKRLMELRYLYKSVITSKDKKENRVGNDYSVNYGFRVMILVAMLAQFSMLYLVFWTAKWSWTSVDAGTWTIGDPESSESRQMIYAFKIYWIFYLFVTQIWKLWTLWSSGANDANTKAYLWMDGVFFTFLNIMVFATLMTSFVYLGAHEHEGKQAIYDAGIYVQAMAVGL